MAYDVLLAVLVITVHLTKILSLMMTSSNGNLFRVTGHLCGEFTGHWWIPHTKASDAELWCFDVFFDRRLNEWLSKQSWGWWFEMPSCPFWRPSNATGVCKSIIFHWLCFEINSSIDRIFRLWGPGFSSHQNINRNGIGCVWQTTCIAVPDLSSSTWVKSNPRSDSKCQYIFCNFQK